MVLMVRVEMGDTSVGALPDPVLLMLELFLMTPELIRAMRGDCLRVLVTVTMGTR